MSFWSSRVLRALAQRRGLALLLSAWGGLASEASGQQESTLDDVRAGIATLPVMAALPFEDIVADSQPGVYRLRLSEDAVDARAFQVKGAPWQVSMRVREPSAFRLHPAMSEVLRPLVGGLAPSEVLFIASGSRVSAPLASFPAELQKPLAAFANLEQEVELAQGVSLFAAVRLDPDSRLGRIQRLLGSRGPVRLGAQIDPGTVQATLVAAGYSAASTLSIPGPTEYELSLILPEFTPPPFDTIGDKGLIHLVHESSVLKVGYGAQKKKDTLQEDYRLEGIQRTRLWLLGKAYDGQSAFKATTKPGDAQGQRELEIERTGTIRVDSPDLFGMEGLGIESVSLAGKISDIKYGEPTTRERADARADQASTTMADGPALGLGLEVALGLGKERKIKGKFEIERQGKDVTELSLALELGPDGLGLRDLPGFERLAGETRFRLDDLVLGYGPKDGSVFLGGKATWVERGLSGRCAILRTHEDKGGVVRLLMLQCEDMGLGKLLPGLPGAADLPLGSALLIYASDNLKGVTGATLGGPAGDMLKKVTGALPRPVSFGQGLTLLTRLDPMGLPKPAREGLEKMGVTEPMLLAGGLGGLSSAAPRIELYADLPSLPVKAPAFLNLEPRRPRRADVEQVGLRGFLKAGMIDGVSGVQLGLGGLMGLRLGESEIQLVGEGFVQVGTGTGVRLSGRMEGDWNEPFGLAGIAFRDLVLNGGYDSSQAVEISMRGGVRVARLDYEMKGLVSIQYAGEAVVPKKLGFSFEGSELSMLTQFQLMGGFVKALVAGPLANAIDDGPTRALLQRVGKTDLVGSVEELLPLPYLKLQDVKVYVATPGAGGAGLDMEGLGVAVRGRLSFMNRELGMVDDFLTLANGLQVHQRLGSVDLGLLRMQGPELLIRAPLPGIPALQDERAQFRLAGAVGAGCSLLDGELEIAVDREAARFHQELELAGYHTAVEAEVNLARWPACLVKGVLGDDARLDTLETVRGAVREKAQAEVDAIKKVVAAARKELTEARESLEKVRQEARARRQARADEDLRDLHDYCKKQSKQAETKAGEQAWNTAADLAGKLRRRNDGSLDGMGPLRKQLSEIEKELDRLKGEAVAEARKKLDQAQSKLEKAVASAKDAVKSVEDDLGVTDARKRIQDAEAALKNFRKTLMSEHIDPITAYAGQLLDSCSIDQVGFENGLDSLCRGTLPRFNIRGSFAGKSFDLQNALQLAPRGQLAKRNPKDLDALVRGLLKLVDRRAADDFVDGLAEE